MNNMYWTDNTYVDALEEHYGNRFAAVRHIAQEARDKSESLHHKISESEALAWVSTGQPPEGYIKRQRNIERLERREVLSSVLEYVNDSEVVQAVHASIEDSIKIDHLIYNYKGVQDEARQSRVRVLCRAVWARIHTIQSLGAT